MAQADIHLSEHLKRSEVACKCGCGFADLTQDTADLFERIRELCCKCEGKDVPIVINSGCRCEQHNKSAGGATHSQHLLGRALDLHCPHGITMDEFHGVCLACNPNGGVGFYRNQGFIHVDTRGWKARWGE